MDFFKKIFSSAYEELWKAVIRPNRDKYRDKDLGPDKFSLRDKWYKRTDFTITNKRNYKLMCSFWEPFDEEREYPRLPVVIYLHGNSSSRCEAIPEIKYLLKKNITVFAFDFSGCGRSEGDYISLGWHEQEDVECVVNFLRKSNKVSSIGLWGRSMGAVTALMYGSKDLSIAGLVLDSPFSSLKVLINELAKSRVNLPDFIVKQAINWVKDIIKEKADFNLDDIEPKEYAGKCFIPAYFCHSKEDTFVNIHHCKDLYNLYAGDKNIVYVIGNHNSERPIHFKDSVAVFFYKALRCKALKERYEQENFADLQFNIENNTVFESRYLNRVNKKNKNKNKSVSEIKIVLRGKYDRNDIKNNSTFKIANESNNKEDKKEKYPSEKSENDIFLKADDNISIKNIVDCPRLKTNSNYIKYICDINTNTYKDRPQNKKIFGPNFNSSILSKTPSKNILDDDITEKDKIQYQSSSQNEKDEEKLQKILQLSKKEFEEISTNTPNFMNNSNSYKKFKKKRTISLLKIGNNKYFNSNHSNKNSISIDINNIDNTKSINNINNKHLPVKSKISTLSAKNIYYNNNIKIINKTELTTSKKVFNVKTINRHKINKINKNNYINNNILKNVKRNKTNKNNNASIISSFLKCCARPSPIKISIPDLILKLNKGIKSNNLKEKKFNNDNNINIYKEKDNKPYNNISLHQIYNFKNKNQNQNKKEEHKNVTNNKRYDLLENVIASPLNNHVKENINKIKKMNYVNTTNNTSSLNIIINNIRKSESSMENESETLVNSKFGNKINESLSYLEDDDKFFLEEDNIGINIPHC
jgi:pimeloyl-ACP methyl ester carboxylesterase